MRTVLAILSIALLLANLACAASCTGKAPFGGVAHEETKLPPCHQPQQEPAPPQCDHSAPNVEITGIPAVLPPLVDHGVVAPNESVQVWSVAGPAAAGRAASPPMVPLRI